MHKSQCYPHEVEHDALEGTTMVVLFLSDPTATQTSYFIWIRCQWSLINTKRQKSQDQDHHNFRPKTITILDSEEDKRRYTAAITPTGSGIHLPSMIIFHGTATGHFARNEHATYPSDAIHATQKKVWMDAWCINVWFDKVLTPYIAIFPAHITLITSLTLTTVTWCQLSWAELRCWEMRSSISEQDVPPSASPSMWPSISHSGADFTTFGQIFWSQTDLWMVCSKPRKNSGCNVNKTLIGHDGGSQ